MFLQTLESLIRTIAHTSILSAVPSSPDLGSWYLSPRQHAMELCLFSAVLGVAGVVALAIAAGRGSKVTTLLHSHPHLPPPKRTQTFHTLHIATVLSWTLLVIQKYITNKHIYLFLPCHVNIAVMAILMSWPKSSQGIRRWKLGYLPDIVFNMYLHAVWGTVLALLAPDASDLHLPLEYTNFFIEHLLLLILPIYLASNRYFVVFPWSWSFCFASFCANGLYYTLVLTGLSFVTGLNLSYMLAPPQGILENLGKSYRIIMTCVAFLLTIGSRALISGCVSIATRVNEEARSRSPSPPRRKQKLPKAE